jgi:2,2-dialkylglycine decarboxylase (pyruvate)
MPTSEAEWLDWAKRHNFRGRMDKGEFSGPIFASAKDSVVVDVEGKQFLDFNSGQMCSALGHNRPEIIAAIQESCASLIHASSMYFNTKEIELAKRLGDILPPQLQKSTFLISGSDSNEAAISMAKVYTGRFEIASPHASFHGLSDTARAVTFAGWHAGYGPLIPGAYAILAPYRYRCAFCQDCPDCTLDCLEASFELLDAQSVGSLAAVITEPLFSAGGVIPAPTVWLHELQKKCRERGMLLIFDEAQTGLGKLGTMFAFEQHDIVPDILTISKHFGGGVSVSAAITSTEIEEVVVDRGYVVGHSHCNDPLGCAAGIASIDLIVNDGVPAQAARLGEYLQNILAGLAQKHEVIGDVRGKGLIQGIELVEDRMSKRPAEDLGRAIHKNLLAEGLICSARRKGSVLRFVPPITTTFEQFDRAGELLDKAIKSAADESSRRKARVIVRGVEGSPQGV